MGIYACAGIRLLYLAAAFNLVDFSVAQQAPWGRPNVPMACIDGSYSAQLR